MVSRRCAFACALFASACGSSSSGADASVDARRDDATLVDASPDSPVGRHGALRVQNNRVVDTTGEPANLHGMSLFWSQWGHTYWNAGAVENLATDWNVDLVRAAVGVEANADDKGYLTDPARETARAKAVVDAAIANGLYVIVDWHDHLAHQHVDQAKTFFTEMASSYAGVPNVIYEIYNEPLAIPWSDVKAYAEQVIPVIRASSPDALVVVGTPNWSQDVDVAAASPLATSNTAYTLHFYAASHRQFLRDKAASALAQGIALFATEWGTPDASGGGSPDLDESRRWLEFLAANDISWSNWALNDKAEATSALVPGASPTGPWADSALTDSGRFVRDELRAR